MHEFGNLHLRGEVSWTSPGVQGSNVYEGTLGELREWVAANVPAKQVLGAGRVDELLLQGGDVAQNVGLLRQVLVLETSEGHLVAKFGPESSRRRPAPARAVHVYWENSRSAGLERVAQRPWGLARRISKLAGIADPAYVQMYLDRAFAADPGADLHKLWLLPRDHAVNGLGVVRVVIDRRPRTHRPY